MPESAGNAVFRDFGVFLMGGFIRPGIHGLVTDGPKNYRNRSLGMTGNLGEAMPVGC